MIKIKRVLTIEPKRTYLIADAIRRSQSKKDFLGKVDKDTWLKKLESAKKKILALPEEKLDKMIAKTYVRRLNAFNNSNWYIGTFKPSEVGVWRRAGGLPLEWTNGSLEETAKNVQKAILKKSKKLNSRAKSAIPNILKTNIENIQDEVYLLPVVFKGNTGTRGRWRLKRQMTGDIDDGCMRSIALTINGAKKIKAYLGFPKK
jgi:hypothetical protein